MTNRLCNELDPVTRSHASKKVSPVKPLASTEQSLRRFDPTIRRNLRKLLRQSARIGDLLDVFPGAAFAIATSYRPPEVTRKSIMLVSDGAPLREVAKTLDLPYWLRRLPPEAFRSPLGKVPATQRFSRQILNKLPQSPEQSAFWLETVCFAANATSDDFAVWLAGQKIFGEYDEAEHLFTALCAYAWHSTHNTPARNLLIAPWRREMSLDTAVCAAKSWLNRLRLVVQVGEKSITEPWLKSGTCHGYNIVPLMTARDILIEAQVMQNCADQYASRIAINKCRLFSVRRQNTPIATLEIAPHSRESGFLYIAQLKGRHNTAAPTEVWQAAYAWLADQPNLAYAPASIDCPTPCDDIQWHKLMAHYRKSRAGAPWLPSSPCPDLFDMLDSGIAELARRTGVRSWLFT